MAPAKSGWSIRNARSCACIEVPRTRSCASQQIQPTRPICSVSLSSCPEPSSNPPFLQPTAHNPQPSPQVTIRTKRRLPPQCPVSHQKDQAVKPTDTRNPDYFHKVVDCQWACPAHTNVPEYIRFIAQERYTDAYMVNRNSNIFPGVLGRTCDRPCEPACRRGRVDGKPVAICRLKRVAADLRGDVRHLLPEIPKQKNGKRVACIGAGPASLGVANDLMPLGYNVTIFEKFDKPGGLMRTNIPSFRLPEKVLMDEINMILDMGVDMRYNSPVNSMKDLLGQGFDAIFVGSGAPRGKNLEIPGRHDTDR